LRHLLVFVLACWPIALAGEALLAEKREALRHGAPATLERLGREGDLAVEPLMRLVAEGEPAVAWGALSALRRVAAQASGEDERRRLAEAFLAHLDTERPAGERRAAAELLGVVGGPAHVGRLEPLLDQPPLFEAAARALARIPGEEARLALFNALARPRPAAQTAALLELLGARGEPASLEAFQAAATVENDLVRLAAARAIATLGEPAGAPTLLRLAKARSHRVRTAAFRAAAALARGLVRKGLRTKAAELLRQCYETSRNDAERAVLLPGLASAEGEDALEAVTRALDSREPAMRHAAVLALRNITGAAAEEALLEAARTAREDIRPLLVAEIGRRRVRAAEPLLLKAAGDRDETTALSALAALERVAGPSSAPGLLDLAESRRTPAAVRTSALRLAIRLADGLLRGGERAEAVVVFGRALRLAATQRNRRDALLGLARTGRQEVLSHLEPVLENGDAPLRPLALEACVAVGDAAWERGERSRAVAAYRRALAAQPDHAPAIAALARLGIHPEMAALKGCIPTWWVIGPFPCGDFRGAALKPWFPEEEIALGKTYQVEGRKLRWRLIHSDHEKGWVVLTGKLRPGNRVLAYAYTVLTLAEATDATLAFGRDDGLTVWVNGQELYNEHGPSALGSQEHSVRTRLLAGENHILVKCTQGGGDWGFYLRATTPDGKPLHTD